VSDPRDCLTFTMGTVVGGYLTGKLPDHELAWLTDHLEGCERCRHRLEYLEAEFNGKLEAMAGASK